MPWGCRREKREKCFDCLSTSLCQLSANRYTLPWLLALDLELTGTVGIQLVLPSHDQTETFWRARSTQAQETWQPQRRFSWRRRNFAFLLLSLAVNEAELYFQYNLASKVYFEYQNAEWSRAPRHFSGISLRELCAKLRTSVGIFTFLSLASNLKFSPFVALDGLTRLLSVSVSHSSTCAFLKPRFQASWIRSLTLSFLAHSDSDRGQ